MENLLDSRPALGRFRDLPRAGSGLVALTALALTVVGLSAPSRADDDGGPPVEGPSAASAETSPEASPDDDRAAGDCTALPAELPAEPCKALTGDDEAREANASWRAHTVRSIEASADTWEITLRGTSVQGPHAGSFADVEVREVVLAADGEDCAQLSLVAVVELGGTLADACHGDVALVRLDDAFGREGRVVAVDREGILVEHRGQLVFLPAGDGTSVPEFDVVWQSGFHLVPAAAPVTAGPKAKPRPRGRRR